MNAIRGATPEGITDEITEETVWSEEEKEDELFRSSLAALSKQARDVLSVSAYEKTVLSRCGLLERFGTNKSNVYNVLSRARVKTNEERFPSTLIRSCRNGERRDYR